MATYGIQTVNFGMKYKYYNIAIILLFLAGKMVNLDTLTYDSTCYPLVNVFLYFLIET